MLKGASKHTQLLLDALRVNPSASTSTEALDQSFSHRSKASVSRSSSKQSYRQRCWKWTTSRRLVSVILGLVTILSLGIIVWLALITAFLRRFSHRYVPTSGVARLINNISLAVPTIASLKSLQPFPEDFTSGILPIPCHSHNDYWRHVPLLDATSAGCTSVEADIWVSTGSGQATNTSELYVGHSRGSMRLERTLRSMYIDPLVYILDQINSPRRDSASSSTSTLAVNGVFESNSDSTMVLLVDFKQSPDKTNIWSLLQQHLQPLRERQYLTYWNSTKNERIMGPVTVVATGDAPFELVHNETTNPHHDIFFDAPLLELEADAASSSPKYTPLTSYYASVDFSKAVGKVWFSLSHSQRVKIGQQTSTASEAGLVSRYWDTPGWPVSVRNKVWEQLIAQGVGALNVDELWTASKKDWRFCSAIGWGICP